MFEGHDPYLVALSVVIAILGGYTGFGLAARIRGTPDASHRVLLAGAAFFLAIGIWTMHFVGMLAAPLPAGTVYLVLPTIVSFLICALVVGISLFFVSVGEPPVSRVVSSAVLLGVGIASMHYVGMHGLSGNFAMTHDATMVVLSVLIAIATAYGGLRAFLARQGGVQLALSAVAYGFAVSGMHYTAMAGMHLVPPSEGCASPSRRAGRVLANAVAGRGAALLRDCCGLPAVAGAGSAQEGCGGGRRCCRHVRRPEPQSGWTSRRPTPARRPTSPRLRPTPLGGLGQPPRSAPAPRLPVEGADGTHFIDTAEIRSVRADAHYTKVHDGTRGADVPVVDLRGRSPARPRPVRPGAPQPYRGDGARHPGSQGRRWRDRRTRRPFAASGAGQPRQDRRGEGPAWPRPTACLLIAS